MLVDSLTGDGYTAYIKRSNRRRSVGIKIAQGKVVVMAPQRMRQKTLQNLVDSKADWIRAKLKHQSGFPVLEPKRYIEGEIFTYLGKGYRLQLMAGINHPVQIVGDQIGVLEASTKRWLLEPERYIKTRLLQWYREQAFEHIENRVAYYAQLMQLKPKSIKVRSYKSRWGSCSMAGDLSFNWKLVIASNEVVDYVVVHELAHILQHNHSPAFWHEVEKVLSNYREQKTWLKDYGYQLTLDG